MFDGCCSRVENLVRVAQCPTIRINLNIPYAVAQVLRRPGEVDRSTVRSINEFESVLGNKGDVGTISGNGPNLGRFRKVISCEGDPLPIRGPSWRAVATRWFSSLSDSFWRASLDSNRPNSGRGRHRPRTYAE